MTYGTVNVDSLVSSDGGVIGPNITSLRNRIINGAMMIDQRNAGASVTPSNNITLDRFGFGNTQSGKFTVQQITGGTETGYATRVAAGFQSYMAATVASAVSVGSGDTFLINQSIEANNISDFAWGTANAKTVTLSFLVYSSLTGTFGGAIANYASTRSYPFSYTISSANTWTQISVTIPGDTSGTWVMSGTGGAMIVRFGLGSGSTFSGTVNTWVTGNLVQPTGTVSIAGTSGATFYITGVQLEKGSTATSFDYRPYGTELALCQRYYAKVNGNGSTNFDVGSGLQTSTTNGVIYTTYPVTMRAAPTATVSGVLLTDHTTYSNATTLGSFAGGFDSGFFSLTMSAAGAQYRPALAYVVGSSNGYVDFSAEL